MKRAAKVLANIVAALAITYALLQLVFNVPAVENALDPFYNMAAWDWIFDKFNIYGPEDQEAIIDNCLAVLCLLISVVIVFFGNRVIARWGRQKGV